MKQRGPHVAKPQASIRGDAAELIRKRRAERADRREIKRMFRIHDVSSYELIPVWGWNRQP